MQRKLRKKIKRKLCGEEPKENKAEKPSARQDTMKHDSNKPPQVQQLTVEIVVSNGIGNR